MASALSIENYAAPNLSGERTALSLEVQAASQTISVDSNQGYSVNDYVVVGNLGSEACEMLKITSVSGANTISFAPASTTLYHAARSAVTKLFGDKIRIYRAPDVNGLPPLDASFTAVTIISIDPDQPSTIYNDASISSSYWYKFVYYNSTTLLETSLSGSSASRGTSDGNYCTVQDIRRVSGISSERWVNDQAMAGYRLRAQEIVNGELKSLYIVPFSTPINPLISSITERLSAWLALTDQVTAFGPSSAAKAKTLHDEAMSDLASIKNGTRVLLDATGVSTAIEGGGVGTLSGLPNDSSVDTATGIGDRLFRVSDIQGGRSARMY